jgi:tRNA(Ile)-lysidine synthetase-like protein
VLGREEEAAAGCRAWLALDRLRLPLLVRGRRPGDRFWPHGCPAEQKLKDFLISAKIPRADRGRLPLLVDATGRIAAVLPLRAADWAIVRPGTGQVLAIEAGAGGAGGGAGAAWSSRAGCGRL